MIEYRSRKERDEKKENIEKWITISKNKNPCQRRRKEEEEEK